MKHIIDFLNRNHKAILPAIWIMIAILGGVIMIGVYVTASL